jgi:hypothetical protein
MDRSITAHGESCRVDPVATAARLRACAVRHFAGKSPFRSFRLGHQRPLGQALECSGALVKSVMDVRAFIEDGSTFRAEQVCPARRIAALV